MLAVSHYDAVGLPTIERHHDGVVPHFHVCVCMSFRPFLMLRVQHSLLHGMLLLLLLLCRGMQQLMPPSQLAAASQCWRSCSSLVVPRRWATWPHPA